MDSLLWLRMPLFTVLSGLVYAQRRVARRDLGPFLGRKARRLLLPLIVATLVFLAARSLMGLEPGGFDPWRALFHPYLHLWFLQALVILFPIVALVDAFWHPGVRALALGACILAAASHWLSSRTPDTVLLGSALYLAPYFLFGMLLGEMPERLQSGRALAVALLVAIVAVGIQQASLQGLLPPIPKTHLVATACGASLVFIVLALLPPLRLLSAIGACSFTIYLWHIFGSAGARMGLNALGVESAALLFLPCLALGLALPIALHRVALLSPLLSWPIAGVRSGARPTRPEHAPRLEGAAVEGL
jgi:peptidoglycan/LPS O-acetylase OafA/YrhL